MVTTCYSDQQGSKSRQKVVRIYKQWHRPMSKRFIKLPYSISRAVSIYSNCWRLLTISVLSNQAENYAPTRFDQQVQVSQGHTSYKNKKKQIIEVNDGGGLGLVKPAREPISSRPSPVHPSKSPTNLDRSPLLVALVGRKIDIGFSLENFPVHTFLILAHRGSALPWLVDDRAALRLRRIWCLPTR